MRPLVLAHIFAVLQIAICAILAFALLVSGFSARSTPSDRYFALCLLALDAIFILASIGFFLRKNWARLFLAGLHAVLSAVWLVAAVALLIASGPAAIVALILFAITLSGAFAFVSIDVRQHCGEHLVVGGDRGDRPGPVRLGRAGRPTSHA